LNILVNLPFILKIQMNIFSVGATRWVAQE